MRESKTWNGKLPQRNLSVPPERTAEWRNPMKTIVIYTSQTGFTKRYAQWIAEASDADCLALTAAKKRNLDAYEAIIFGGWACAGSISKLGWFKDNIGNWPDKKLIAFCVGASPMDSPEVAQSLNRNFTETERERISVFYCPGGLNYEKMPAPSRFLMKMFVRTLKAKKDKTETDREMIRMISGSYDISDRKYIEPIVKLISGR